MEQNITVLFPGGFKPLTGAHMELAQRYANLPQVSQVIMLIAEKERDGITRNDSMEIFKILNTNPKIKMQPTPFPSPILAAYEYLFALPQDTTGNFALAASTKGDDYVRTMTFSSNVEKYKTVGDKNQRKIAPGIDAVELSNIGDPENSLNSPLMSDAGDPISATTLRSAIADQNYELFATGYPDTDPNKIKQIWHIVTRVQESVFSKTWWTSALSEDLDAVIEAVMNKSERKRHNSKISKLRSYLDSNSTKSFVYDFDKFPKTVYGTTMLTTESVLKENYITRQELAQIENTIDSFFKKYNINVNFQGGQTHFIDRLNDPRNESPIYMDELVDLFRDLSDEYGDQIATQLQKNKPGAIESDYQFDVPIHMPFMLQFNPRTKMIDLIPKTIKKQRRPWINSDKSQIIYRIESAGKSGNLLTEGGAAGHMAHPWDDHGLTFNDMREIVNRALSGRLDMEHAVTEKTDGQNIQVTWKNGQPGFARNKGTVINPLTPEQLIADFERKYQESVAKNGAEAAAGYKLVVDAYRACAEDLTEALNQVGTEKLAQIFKDGRVFANMEIIYPSTKNVIAYDKAHLQFHNLVEYDEKGNTVETDLTGGALMQRVIEEANAHMQNTFSFIPPQQLKLGQVYNFEDQKAAFFSEIDQLQNKYNLQPTDRISEYHKAWWADVIKSQAQNLNYEIPQNILDALIYRWAFFDKSANIAALKKQIANPEFIAWVDAFDKKDVKVYRKENMEPFESIFLRLGVVVLQNAQNFLAANPSKTVQEIRTDLAQLIKELQTASNVDTLNKLKHELRRIEKLGGFDSIVPSEGLVFTYAGNTYKMTGAFAPVNQILGVLKYAR